MKLNRASITQPTMAPGGGAKAIIALSLVSALLTLLSACATLAPSSKPDLSQATVAQLQQQMQAGELTAARLAQYYLDRIENWNPHLNAVIAVNPKAIEQAQRLDQERSAGQVRGPLHGIPVIIKDNIESQDMPTTAGSLVLTWNNTKRDAPLVANLREAGAIILAKANLSEWANFRSTRSSSGWSGVGGQTRNPYDLSRNPCGSSSGSAVAVAAGLSPLAIGTETNGSIVCPAHANGVVGIKPTVGLVSRSGVVPISHSQDTAGPMATNVADAVALLGAMQGADPQDSATHGIGRQQQRNYRSALNPRGLRGKRIGVLRSSAGFHEAVDALLNQALDDLRAQGAIIVDDLEINRSPAEQRAAFDVLLYEFKHDLNHYFSTLPGPLADLTLERVIVSNKENAELEMPWFQQELLELSQAKGPLTEETYTEALATAKKSVGENGIDRLLAEHQLDALMAPTGGPAWTTDLVNGDNFGGSSSSFAAISGYPNITVPMGYVHALPVGVSFFAGAFAEPTVIEIAYAYEQATQHRRAPVLKPYR